MSLIQFNIQEQLTEILNPHHAQSAARCLAIAAEDLKSALGEENPGTARVYVRSFEGAVSEAMETYGLIRDQIIGVLKKIPDFFGIEISEELIAGLKQGSPSAGPSLQM